MKILLALLFISITGTVYSQTITGSPNLSAPTKYPTAHLRLQDKSYLRNPEVGMVEFDGKDYWLTDSTGRVKLIKEKNNGYLADLSFIDPRFTECTPTGNTGNITGIDTHYRIKIRYEDVYIGMMCDSSIVVSGDCTKALRAALNSILSMERMYELRKKITDK